jgi:hypothetical protein
MRHWAAVLILLCLMCLGMVPVEIFWIAGFLALSRFDIGADCEAMLAEDVHDG